MKSGNSMIAGLIGGVGVISAVGCFAVSIANVQKKVSDCTVKSLSILYIIVMIALLLSLFTAGSGVARGNSDLSIGGGSIFAFCSVILAIIGMVMLFHIKKIEEPQLRKANYAFWIVYVVSIIVAGLVGLASGGSFNTASQSINAIYGVVKGGLNSSSMPRSGGYARADNANY